MLTIGLYQYFDAVSIVTKKLLNGVLSLVKISSNT